MKTGICFVTLTILLQIFTTTAEAESKIGRGSLTFLGITPGESTFNDVTRAFGRAEARRTGDAGTSETNLCYRILEVSGETTIVFASHSEMAGPPNFKVTSIRLYGPDIPFTENQDCTGIRFDGKVLSTSNGLKLGLTEQELLAKLGDPKRRSGDNLIYTSCVTEPMLPSDPNFAYWSRKEGCFKDENGGWTGKPYYEVCSGVTVKLKDARTIYLELGSNNFVC